MQHEEVRIVRGARSGLPVIVAIHSTKLGPAGGGCRIKTYPSWTDGLTDALRLSAGMTEKNALAGLPLGGGKTVVALPSGTTDFDRRAVLLDVADMIESLDGRYATGPDVGTGPSDMDIIGERTTHVCCRTVEAGGSGDSSPHTAEGVLAALSALCAHRFGSSSLGGHSFAVLGLGHVGSHVATRLAAQGARLLVSDVDLAKQALATELGAAWLTPDELLVSEVDVLVPAALGGVLTRSIVPALRCSAIAGPANNQLDEPSTAHLLHERDVLWVPDYVVSAGGVAYAASVELLKESVTEASRRVASIGDTVTSLLAQGGVPADAAGARVRELLG
jgi:glutamate dehydrogenase/leucine dehydrogenase